MMDVFSIDCHCVTEHKSWSAFHLVLFFVCFCKWMGTSGYLNLESAAYLSPKNQNDLSNIIILGNYNLCPLTCTSSFIPFIIAHSTSHTVLVWETNELPTPWPPALLFVYWILFTTAISTGERLRMTAPMMRKSTSQNLSQETASN